MKKSLWYPTSHQLLSARLSILLEPKSYFQIFPSSRNTRAPSPSTNGRLVSICTRIEQQHVCKVPRAEACRLVETTASPIPEQRHPLGLRPRFYNTAFFHSSSITITLPKAQRGIMKTGEGQATGRASSSSNEHLEDGTQPMQPDSAQLQEEGTADAHRPGEMDGSRASQEVSNRRRKYPMWTVAEEQYLMSMGAKGTQVDWPSVANLLGRTVTTVRQHLARLHAANRVRTNRTIISCSSTRWTARENESLLAMEAENVDRGVMASRLGRSRASIQNHVAHLRSLGLLQCKRRSNEKWTAEEDELLRDMMAKQLDLAAMAKRIKRTTSAIQYRISKLNAEKEL